MRLFVGSPVALAAGFGFTAILVLAAIGDLRNRRISNRLVAVLATLGFVFSVTQTPGFPAIVRSFEGLSVGLVCWLPFYALGWLGAGDVKLFAAAGTWLGPARALEGALIGALAGAVLAVVWMLKSRGPRSTFETLEMAVGSPGLLARGTGGAKNEATLPYGIALAFGAICAAWIPSLPLG